ncbi:Putative uncharacterized protein [Lacticaseibacillus paracasei]|nr:Putative uncharacterized protein [Lacticaseibacillus paracasei]
MTRNLGMSVL